MKKSFFLYFLILSPLLFGQNNYFSNFDDSGNNPIFDQEYSIPLLKNNLTIIDKSGTNNFDNTWVKEPQKIPSNENEFSSLLLMKQLEELNFKTPFNIVHNPTLERFIRSYLQNRKEEISNLMDRAEYYFPMFEEYLDKYDLPLEIKYLAIVESALKPNAVSPSGAKGLWQFMYSTGKEYNLQVSSYVDDRFDPIKSTEAACLYLTKLYQSFNDWDLALAAYNSGPGNVRKAIRRSGGKQNYWEIRQYLSKETRSYLPAFYATYYIFEYSKTHDLKSKKSDLTYVEIDTIHVKKQLSFATIQKNISIDYKILKALNPQYKKDIIPYSKSKYYVLTLPKYLVQKFIDKEKIIYQSPNQNFIKTNPSNVIRITKSNSYVVKNGDNLNKIALKHNITLAQLKNWNGLQTDYLITGQRLVVTKNKLIKTNPFSPKVSPTSPSIEINKSISNESKIFETYIVKEGDTLFNISRRFSRVSIDQIKNWNNLYNITFLKPGTKLKIFKS